MKPNATPIDSATAEAVKGLCAARIQTAEHRAKLMENGMWCRYDEHWKRFTDEIASIDARIDTLLREQPNGQASATASKHSSPVPPTS